MKLGIETKSITKIFPIHKGETRALTDLSLSIEKGSVYGLTGANGSGKSTLLRLLATLLIPTSGQAWVNGSDTVKEEKRVRASIGLALGSERSFYWRLTGLQNLQFFASLYGLPSSSPRVSQALEMLGLVDQAHKQYMSYSSGFKRRLDLARAMLREPPVYLLDEPTSAIDPHSTLQIRQIIMDLKTHGHTVLLVTHNLGEAEKLCDRVGILDKGVFLAEGTMSQLRQLASGTRIRLQLTPPVQADCLSVLYRVEGIERIQMDAGEILLFVRHGERALHSLLALIREQGWQLTNLHMEEPTLEDVFFRLVGR